MFTELPDSSVALVVKGVFTPAKVYSLGKFLFAKKAANYYKLYINNATSHSGTRYDFLVITPTIKTTKDKYGYLIIDEPKQIKIKKHANTNK